MAVVDDILGAVMIFFVIIIMIVFMMNKVIVRESSNVEMENKDFMQDYFATALDTFLHFDENVTKRPFNVILGDYAYSGKYLITTGEGTIDVKRASKKALDYIFGPGNYYMEIHPIISDVYISFVIDGSNSLQDERDYLANEFSTITDTVNTVFEGTEATVNINIYILSEESKATMCSSFPTSANVQCDTIQLHELYSTTLTTLSYPTFGHASFAAWQATSPYAKPDKFFEGDWMAGIVYAQEQFMSNVSFGKQNTQGVALHFTIPVTDELSTGSTADACFNIRRTSQMAQPDYIACTLCDNTCPVARSERSLGNITTTLTNLGNYVIPVFSFQCSFKYETGWNWIPETPYNSQFINFPIGNNICDESSCNGCEAGVNLNSFCWHTDCHDAIRDQMEYIANETSGKLINITDTLGLAQEILGQINDTFQEIKLTLGIHDEERTRYVYTRNILLPSYMSTELTFWAYETPFIDKQPPNIMNLSIIPWMGRNGTIFEIVAGIEDNSTLFNVSIEVRTPQGDTFIRELGDHYLEYHYITIINSTNYTEGDYWVSVIATDLFGNTARADDMDFFRINDTDVTPPIIINAWADPEVVKKADGWTGIHVNATDDINIVSVTAEIEMPDGTIRIVELDHIVDDLYSALAENLVQIGVYKVHITVTDGGGNTAEIDIEFTVTDKMMRVLFVPIGFGSASEWADNVDYQTGVFLTRLPVRDCDVPEDHIEFVAVESNLCSSMSCTCHCYSCADRVVQCYNNYKTSTGDTKPFDLLVGITKMRAGCEAEFGLSGGYVAGCVAGLGNYVSSSTTISPGSIIHEAGHSLGLCHVGPTGGSCGNPDMSGNCYNHPENEKTTCIMNYCHSVPLSQKFYCDKGYGYLKDVKISEYVEGCP